MITKNVDPFVSFVASDTLIFWLELGKLKYSAICFSGFLTWVFGKIGGAFCFEVKVEVHGSEIISSLEKDNSGYFAIL